MVETPTPLAGTSQPLGKGAGTRCSHPGVSECHWRLAFGEHPPHQPVFGQNSVASPFVTEGSRAALLWRGGWSPRDSEPGSPRRPPWPRPAVLGGFLLPRSSRGRGFLYRWPLPPVPQPSDKPLCRAVVSFGRSGGVGLKSHGERMSRWEPAAGAWRMHAQEEDRHRVRSGPAGPWPWPSLWL